MSFMGDLDPVISFVSPVYHAHMFYLKCNSLAQRTSLIDNLKQNEILVVFHYISLHNSPYYKNIHGGRILINRDIFTERLVRLPFYFELDIEVVVNILIDYNE